MPLPLLPNRINERTVGNNRRAVPNGSVSGHIWLGRPGTSDSTVRTGSSSLPACQSTITAMGFPSDVNMEERSGKTRLKGARKPKDPRIRRRLNFHMDKRRDRSKFGNGRLVEPDDIFPDESSGDIFGTALLAREDSGDGFVVAAPNEDSGDGFSVAAPNETSADEVPEATPLPNDASAEEVVEDEAIEDEASEAEVVEEDLPLPNLDSEDVAVADSPLPNEASEDETAGGSPLPNEESEDETVNGAPLPNEASEDATGEDSSFPNEESEDETGDGSTNPNEDLDDELLQEDDYYSLPNEQSSKSPSGLDGSLTESPTFSPNAPPRPGAPTRAPKKTYPPAYFAPLPTPRPTNARPVAPVRPTRRPTKKMTPGPTLTPTMSPRPTIMPSLKPFTESPTFKPSTEADPLPVPTDPPVPDPTEPPTRSPTAVVPRDCVSDEEGNKGPQIAPNQEIVSYRFQVETYATMTEDELNDEALPEAEREISDVLIPPLFYPGGECDALVAEGRSGGLLSLTLQDRVDQAASDKRAEKPKGSRSDGWETQPGGRRWLLDRHMQEEDGLIGLSSSPPDVVIRGRLQSKLFRAFDTIIDGRKDS